MNARCRISVVTKGLSKAANNHIDTNQMAKYTEEQIDSAKSMFSTYRICGFDEVNEFQAIEFMDFWYREQPNTQTKVAKLKEIVFNREEDQMAYRDVIYTVIHPYENCDWWTTKTFTERADAIAARDQAMAANRPASVLVKLAPQCPVAK